MKKIFWSIPLLALLMGLFASNGCYYDNVTELHPELQLNNDCDTTATMSYQTHIKPILANSCGANNSCHNTQGAGGGVVLENYAGVKSTVNNGNFISAIIWDGNASQMPKGSPTQLSACSIAKIQKWVDNGALDN